MKSYGVRIFAVVLLWVICMSVQAQTFDLNLPIPHLTKDTLWKTQNGIDMIDLIKRGFKIKSRQRLSEATRKGPFITALPYPNYTQATGFAGVASCNISFYTNQKTRDKLSYVNNTFQYTQYNQIIAFSLSNIFFDKDKWSLVGDWRYYKFPTYTYGLGSNSSNANQDQIDYSHLRVYEMVMRKVVKNTSVGIGYHLDYHWGIEDENAEKGMKTDFTNYGYHTHSMSSGLSANFQYDDRNNANNTRSGTYFNMQFRANLKPLGSDHNWYSILVDARHFIPMPTPWRSTLAFWGYGWMIPSGRAPYLDLPSVGWDMFNNTGRGYAMGRFRGKNMLYFETEYRYDILQNGLLGGVFFVNVQSYANSPSGNMGFVIPAGGLGVRVKLNKHTNSNLCIDYAVGINGANGFSFNLSEVF